MKNENAKDQWEPMGLERFGHLEDKIFRVVEAFKVIKGENDKLQEENQRLRGEVQALRQGQEEADQNAAQLMKEREELRERVEKALGLLASLEIR